VKGQNQRFSLFFPVKQGNPSLSSEHDQRRRQEAGISRRWTTAKASE